MFIPDSRVCFSNNYVPILNTILNKLADFEGKMNVQIYIFFIPQKYSINRFYSLWEMLWFNVIFKIFDSAIFEVVEANLFLELFFKIQSHGTFCFWIQWKFNLEWASASTTSRTALPNISKIKLKHFFRRLKWGINLKWDKAYVMGLI